MQVLRFPFVVLSALFLLATSALAQQVDPDTRVPIGPGGYRGLLGSPICCARAEFR
jgi:hypothetical protein